MREFCQAGKKTYFPSYSANTILNECALLKAEAQSKNIPENEYFAIYHADIDEKNKKEDFSNVDQAWTKVQHVLTSSTCLVGVSFEKEHFDCAFFLVGKGGCSARELRQMLHQVRNS